jgi:glycosyltransferase involved in cell wall biosynthesis
MTKIAEYLAVGLPVLVADLPENRVTAGDAAQYFQPADARDLARALIALLDDPRQIRAMRDAALDRAPALVWERSARRLVAAYEWLLDRGPAVAGDQQIDVVVEVAA